jgi:threonine dehydrogenase-like Zn-dependent dehydrogenase
MSLPAANLHLVPDSVQDEAAVFCEPLAAAFEILEQISLSPDDRVLVLGDGKLGQLIVRALRTAGSGIVLAGTHPHKLRLAAEQGFATVLVDDLKQHDFDVVVEATGSPEGFQTALQLVKPRGRLILKSTLASPGGLDLTPVVIDEITVIGSRCGPFPPALNSLEAGLEVTSLITAVFPFDQALQAFEAARHPDSLKVLLDMRDSSG